MRNSFYFSEDTVRKFTGIKKLSSQSQGHISEIGASEEARNKIDLKRSESERYTTSTSRRDRINNNHRELNSPPRTTTLGWMESNSPKRLRNDEMLDGSSDSLLLNNPKFSDSIEPEAASVSSVAAPVRSTPAAPAKPLSCLKWIKSKIYQVYETILFPVDFLAFNIICIIQTAPALTYYIYFFQRNYYLPNSSGMPAVWGCTIGAISSAIVGSALTPVPANIITRSVCTAVVIWEFVISLSAAAAAIGLGLQRLPDWHGVVWAAVCCLSSLSCGLYLRWIGLTIISMNRDMRAKQQNDPGALEAGAGAVPATIRSFNSEDMALSGIYGLSGSSSSDSTEPLAVEKPKEVNSETPKASGGGWLSCIVVRLVQALLWLVLIVFYLVPIGFGANSIVQMLDSNHYGPPGLTFAVPVHYSAFNDSSITHRKSINRAGQQTVRLHIHCSGSSWTGRPTIVMEADANMTGFAYRNLQILLSAPSMGWRVCLYDRAGLGWSAMSPLGSNRPTATASRLRSLLSLAGEVADGRKLLLIGHGDGFTMVQLFTYVYPDLVAGVGMLDGFPSVWRIQGRSGRDIYDATTATCGTLNMLRALESLGVGRALLEYYWSSARSFYHR